MLPDWLQQLADECPEKDKLKLTQTDYNRRTLAKQAEAGLVRVSVMVPKDKAEELKELARRLREHR